MVQACLHVLTRMAQLKIHVLADVVQHLARHQMDYFVIIMDLHVQHRLVHQVEVERAEVAQVEVAQVEAAPVVQAALNVLTKMAPLQIRVLVGVVRHIARHQTD